MQLPIAVPSWCKCGECYKMPRKEENVCCSCIEKRPCISGNVIKKICESANEGYTKDHGELRRRYYEAAAELRKTDEWGKTPEICNGGYRPLPSCLIWQIRKKHPSPGSKYTGFQPRGELIPLVVQALQKCREDMDTYMKAVSIADPENSRQIPDPGGTNPISLAKQLLPKLAVVATGAAIEIFMEEAKSCCIDMAFVNVTMTEKNFKAWVKQRATDPDAQKFLNNYLENRKKDMNKWKEKIREKLLEEYETGAPTQDCVGLNQTVLDASTKELRNENKYRQPTMYALRELIVSLVLTEEELKKDEEKQKNVARKIKELVTQVIEDETTEIWEICTCEPGEVSISATEVKCGNYEGFAHLSNLFYGIRNLMAHGTPEYTIERGVLSRMPSKSSDFCIKVAKQKQEPEADADARACDQMFHLWQKAAKNGNKLDVGYDLFRTIQSFYKYFAAIVGKTCACVVCVLSEELLLKKTHTVAGHDLADIKALLEKVHWSDVMQ